jgi:FKBP-type peptidyl-prolyl cis-trans isomerase FkpA
MKTLLSLLLLAPAAFAADPAPAPAAAPKAEAKPAAAKDGFKNDDERVIYALGRALGRNVAPFNLSAAEVKLLNDGVRDQLADKKSPVDLPAYTQKINDLLRARMGALAEKEIAKGREYAAAFTKEEGVKEIPGGGWYKSLAAGSGDMPTAADTVKVHYRGTLIDGTEFDSSYKRGEPIETGLQGGLIQCWLKAIPLIKKGGKAKLVCPSEVAYGEEGRPPTIKGGATLVFEVELVDIVKAPKDGKKK